MVATLHSVNEVVTTPIWFLLSALKSGLEFLFTTRNYILNPRKREYNGNLSRNAASMEKCTEIQKKNTEASWKQCDMSPLLVSMEMQKKTNISQQGRGKNLLVIKQGSENKEILILYYVGKMAQHISGFLQRIITINISNYIKVYCEK